MVDTIGQAKSHQNTFAQVLEHKLTPWLLAGLAYLGGNLIDNMQNNDADLRATVNEMAVKIAVIETRTAQFADNAPNRWTRKQHELYAEEVDRRFMEHARRIERMEKTQ